MVHKVSRTTLAKPLQVRGIPTGPSRAKYDLDRTVSKSTLRCNQTSIDKGELTCKSA
jgi:hypothetical protein